MSTPSSSSRLSGAALTSAGCTAIGLRLANIPSSGRTVLCGLSHFGPPTAPSRTASLRLASSRLAAGSATPSRSMALPPITASLNSSCRPNRPAHSSSTARACAVTSGPIPSPGSTAMLTRSMSSSSRSLVLHRLRVVGMTVFELVERVHVRQRARPDDVGVDAVAADGELLVAQRARCLPLGIGIGGDGAHLVALQARAAPDDPGDRLEAGVDHAVAARRLLALAAVDPHPDPRLRRGGARGRHAEVQQLIAIRAARAALSHQREQILVVDMLLLVGKCLESGERLAHVE